MVNYRYILIVVAVLFAGCRADNVNVSRFQNTLNDRMQEAADATARVCSMLEREALDSLYMLVSDENNKNRNIVFYIFDESGPVFWSDNSLSVSTISQSGYQKWYYRRFNNAHTICRITTMDNYSILTIIPVKYAYPFENEWLQNDFIPPFECGNDWDIVPLLSDERMALYSAEGDYLFSLRKRDMSRNEESARVQEAVPSFSYRNLFGKSSGAKQSPLHVQVKVVLILCVVVLLVMLIWVIYLIIKHRDIRNLPLRYKILVWFSLLLLISFVYVAFVVRSQIRERYVEGQRRMIEDKCFYIQAAIKSKVVYMPSLDERQSHDLSLELKELAQTYKTDIHVYDLAGNLISTTFPDLFSSGLCSKRIAPQPMFRRYFPAAGADSRGVEPMILYEYIGSMKYVVGYIDCINWDDIQIGYISVPFYISENEMQASLDAVMLKILPAYLVALLLLMVVSVIISRALTYPIMELGKRLRNLDPTRQNDKLLYEGRDEVGDLVESYNKMVDDLNRNVLTLTEKERESAWQTMARQVAHEINNPLTPMKLTVQQMQRAKLLGGERFDSYFDKATGMLIEQIDTLSRIAGSFSAFAKNLPEEINLDKVDVAAILNNSVTMYANYDGITVRYIGPESDVIVYADVEQIGRVFVNILQNAVQAMEQNGGSKDIIVMLKQDKDWVEISISDTGPGIAEELRDKIFLPNFTTKTTGMGLGLAMCKNIVGRSGGELWYESKKGKGTTFFIRLRIV